ncbi:MAG: ArsR family transcriptional regulator [Nitrososphaerales archaeon]
MDEAEAKARLSQLLPPEVLADSIKLKIIKLLSIREMCEYELIFTLNTKNVPEHAKALEKAGIVKNRREGLRLFYSLANPEIGKLVADSKIG